MSFSGGCCGGSVRRRRPAAKVDLPANPVVPHGVLLVYLGSGLLRITGAASGETYVVSEQRRHVRVHEADAGEILRNREIMLAP
jgi:hypothetical protein